mmetsp:Transcript_34722/g.55841  ORF Transcript_34722/g.55841 Transcript_34722/m.55841 type:complete len:227 (+) Transcript_34722:291-971(+)
MVWMDEHLHEVAPHRLVAAISHNLCSLEIPLIDLAAFINAKDRCVCGVDEQTQISYHAIQVTLSLLSVRYILHIPSHARNSTMAVEARDGVEKHVDALLVLGEERELESRRVVPLQRIIKHPLHLHAILGADELLHEVTAHHLVASKSNHLRCLEIPLVDPAPQIDAENRRVCRVQHHSQVRVQLRHLPVRGILTHAHHTHHNTVRVTAWCRVEQHLHRGTQLRDQ